MYTADDGDSDGGSGLSPSLPSLGYDTVQRPWQASISTSPLQEFAFGFANELHEVKLTPGLAHRSFGAAARLVFLRYHVLLLAVRVRAAPDGDDGTSGLSM